MAWTSPVTFVAGQTLSSTLLNTHLRDNLLELAPAKATTGSGFFVSTGANSLTQRKVSAKRINTSESTTSTSYTNLATFGPQVIVNTGTSAIVIIAARMAHTVADRFCGMTWVVTGSTTVSASEAWALQSEGLNANNDMSASSWHRYETLTPGSNTFTAKYRCDTATAWFKDRILIVLPL